jgi:AraC-like DNA-binding protein
MDPFVFFARILVPETLPWFPRPFGIGEEIRIGPGYRQDGAHRRDAPHLIFQYTLSGSGRFRDRRGEYELGPGRGFLCASHDPDVAYYYPESGRTPWHFVYLGFGGQAAADLVRDLTATFGPVYDLPVEHAAIRALLAFRVYNRTRCHMTVSAGARMVWDLLLALLSAREQGPAPAPDHDLVRQVETLVRDRIGIRVTVRELAQQLRLSREHLTRDFTRRTGVSPYRYILGQKMLAACSLLKSGKVSVKEAAHRLGFDSTAHFIRAFRSQMRQTPGQFQRSGSMPAMVVRPRRKSGPTPKRSIPGAGGA